MIFIDSARNNPDGVFDFGQYHPRRNGTNPLHDDYSKNVLKFKDGDRNLVQTAIGRLDPQFHRGIAVACVPSSNPARCNGGIVQLARGLAANGRIDATSCLVRITQISKLAKGGNRSQRVHFDSIRVESSFLIIGRPVLLLDDVCTTENSLLACRTLLLQAGATVVQCVALARTV